jgi:hypothetical protein
VLGLSVIAVFYAVSGAVLSVLLRARKVDIRTGSPSLPKKPSLTAIMEPVRWLIGNRVLLLLAIVGFSVSLSWGTWLSLEPYHLIETEPTTITRFSLAF